jgi:hypothetical protein
MYGVSKVLFLFTVVGVDERPFLLGRQKAYGAFAYEGGGTVFARLLIAHANRPAAASVTSARAFVVLNDAALDIIRDTRVQRAVATLDDVQVPETFGLRGGPRR